MKRCDTPPTLCTTVAFAADLGLFPCPLLPSLPSPLPGVRACAQAIAYAADMARNVPAQSMAVIKAQLLRHANTDADTALRESNKLMILSTTKANPQFAEGVSSFVEGRPVGGARASRRLSTPSNCAAPNQVRIRTRSRLPFGSARSARDRLPSQAQRSAGRPPSFDSSALRF